MKIVRVALVSLVAALSLTTAANAGLIGSSVNGQMMIDGLSQNYFDPANGYVPDGYENTAGPTVLVSSSQTEFGFQDEANLDTADFTGTTLTFSDKATDGGSIAIDYVFTDSAFAGLTLTQLTDTFDSTVSATLVGDVLTLDVGSLDSDGTFSVSYSLLASDVPEPSSLALMGGGILGLMGFAAMRRRKAKVA